MIRRGDLGHAVLYAGDRVIPGVAAIRLSPKFISMFPR